MAISYNPGITNRSGELLGAGIERGAASLADAIEKIAQQHKELKAQQSMRDAYGELLGIPKESLEKMSAADTRKFNIVAPIKWEQTKRQSAANAFQGFLTAFQKARQPQTATVSRNMDDGTPYTVPTTTPGLSLPDAFTRAVAANPGVSANPDTMSEATGFVKALTEMQPKQLPQKFNVGGTDILWNPNTGTDQQVRPQPKTRPDAKEPYNITLKDSAGKPYDVLFDPTTGKSERVRTATGTSMETTQYRAAAQRLLARERAAHDELMSGQLFKSPNLADLQKGYDVAKSASDEFFNGQGGDGGAKRVPVTGPNGEKGTVEEGDELPEGWSLQ